MVPLDEVAAETETGAAPPGGPGVVDSAESFGHVGAPMGVVTTRDWTPLEPEVTEEKHYAPGIGKAP